MVAPIARIAGTDPAHVQQVRSLIYHDECFGHRGTDVRRAECQRAVRHPDIRRSGDMQMHRDPHLGLVRVVARHHDRATVFAAVQTMRIQRHHDVRRSAGRHHATRRAQGQPVPLKLVGVRNHVHQDPAAGPTQVVADLEGLAPRDHGPAAIRIDNQVRITGIIRCDHRCPDRDRAEVRMTGAASNERIRHAGDERVTGLQHAIRAGGIILDAHPAWQGNRRRIPSLPAPTRRMELEHPALCHKLLDLRRRRSKRIVEVLGLVTRHDHVLVLRQIRARQHPGRNNVERVSIRRKQLFVRGRPPRIYVLDQEGLRPSHGRGLHAQRVVGRRRPH